MHTVELFPVDCNVVACLIRIDHLSSATVLGTGQSRGLSGASEFHAIKLLPAMLRIAE